MFNHDSVFFIILRIVCRVDWIGCGSEYTELSLIGLDWVTSCWIGLDWILQNGPMSNSGIMYWIDIRYGVFLFLEESD